MQPIAWFKDIAKVKEAYDSGFSFESSRNLVPIKKNTVVLIRDLVIFLNKYPLLKETKIQPLGEYSEETHS